MNKEQIKQEIEDANVEYERLKSMKKYVDEDFEESLELAIKSVESRINALIKKAKKIEASEFWNGYILSCMQVPVGVKKETAVAKQIGF